jgi:hypothetical protein
MRPRTPADALTLTCTTYRELGLSLEIGCACGRTTLSGFRGLLIEHPSFARVEIGRIVPRLRCKACSRPPARVALVHPAEAALAAANGPGSGRWEVLLLGGP